MRGGRGGYNARGGGSTRGTYYSGATSYNNNPRMQSSSRPSGSRYNNNNNNNDNHYNSGGGANRYHGSQSGTNYYDNRNRDKFNTSGGSSGRYDSAHKRSYQDSSRDRRDDRKRPRQDDYRRTTTNNTGRSDRPSTSSSQPMASSSSSNYHHRSSAGGGSGGGNSNNNTPSTYRPRDNLSSATRHHRSSSMGPPKRAPLRALASSNYLARPRGTLSSRGGIRPSLRGVGGNMRIVRNRESENLRIMRRKLLYAQQKDRARVLKIQRLTSSLRRRRLHRNGTESPRRSSKKSDDESSNEDNDDDDEEEEDDNEEDGDVDDEGDDDGATENKKKVLDDDDIKDEKSDSETTKKSSPTKRSVKAAVVDIKAEEAEDIKKEESTTPNKSKKNVESSAVNDDAEEHNAEEDAADIEDDTKLKDKASSSVKESPQKTGKKKEKDGSVEDKEKAAKRKKEKSEKRKERPDSDDEGKDRKLSHTRHHRDNDPRKRTFIKLTCIHCNTKCVTFKEYSYHLNSRTHNNALRQVALRQRADLLRLRARQRTAQREIEENIKEQYESRYCRLCRLAYRQPKTQHQLSDHHKTIKKFLMPYCSSCHLAFKNSMLYEVHRCSLDHIRNKARNQDSDSDNSADEREIDLNKFLTVDSVGEIDNDMDADVDALLQESEAAQNADDAEAKQRSFVGSKFITPIEAFYCELCNHYSAKVGEDDTLEKYTQKHCMQRSHVKAYLRHKEEEDRTAKKNAKKLKTENDSLDKDIKSEKADGGLNGDEHVKVEQSDAIGEGSIADHDNGEDYDEDTDIIHDERLWEEVDKDLGDLLAEVETLARDDDEEDESVLNIDIESEKPKPKELISKDNNKELNGKKEESHEAGKETTVKATITPKSVPTPKATTAASTGAISKATTSSAAKPKPLPQRKAIVAVRKLTINKGTPEKAKPAAAK